MWLTNVDVDWFSRLGEGGEGFVVLGKWNDETVAVRSLFALDNESVENERIKVGVLVYLVIISCPVQPVPIQISAYTVKPSRTRCSATQISFSFMASAGQKMVNLP